QQRRVVALGGSHQLDCDVAIDAHVVCEPNFAHAAATELLAHCIALAIGRWCDEAWTSVVRDERRRRLRLQIVLAHRGPDYPIRPLGTRGSCSHRSCAGAPAIRASGELRRDRSPSDLPMRT